MAEDEETPEEQSTDQSSAEDEELDDIEESMTEEGDSDEPVDEEDEDTEPVDPVVNHDGEFYGTGRRKESVARVWIEAGDGDITVNDDNVDHYFNNRASWIKTVWAPLEELGFEDDIDIWATLEGGGLTGQADALKLGLARALVEMDENARTFLKQEGHLTRDAREQERKKINQPGARAKQQVSKR